jgi:predicted Zn-ribbon and HTH transcriptional regulator
VNRCPRGIDSRAVTIRKVRVTAYRAKCERCGRTVTVLAVPDRCPTCKARNWLQPARTYTRRK